MLKGKKILLGVTGSIAAYKAALIVRLFIKSGAEVKVLMTDAATEFITPLTLSTLSKNPVFTEFYTRKDGVWNNHVDLGLWADLFIIAPASANTMAKLVHGQSDNLLTATYLSAKCPVFIAPAMDLDMWKHPSTQSNIEALESYGNKIIPVGEGELASGLSGAGRMAEPEDIITFSENEIISSSERLPLSGKKVLINAGPTYEAIDPVRFIGNRSSGKMGVALANVAAEMGAEVKLILGPSSQRPSYSSIDLVMVTSAAEMFEATDAAFSDSDITILCAAVADFTPKKVSDIKIKKKDNSEEISVELERTKDILKTMGEKKSENQILVGFALETNNEEENAKAKLKKKNLDLIVLNSLQDKGAGFQGDTNKVTLFDKNNNISKFELKSKAEVAADIINKVIEFSNA